MLGNPGVGHAAASTASTALVSGQVLAAAVPVAGASVALTAWPGQDTLQALPEGGLRGDEGRCLDDDER